MAFSQNVRSGRMALAVAEGKTWPVTLGSASQVVARFYHGSPVERAPNSSMTTGRTWPEPAASEA